MIAAYLAQVLLSEGGVNVAEVTPVKKRTALIFPEDKTAAAYTVAKSLAESSANARVVVGCGAVNVDLPADTATIRALVCGTFEFIIVCWSAEYHLRSSE